MSNAILEAALSYAARGWRVIPLIQGEKRPAMTAWPEFATTDRLLIVKWWTEFPLRGVGIVTGIGSCLLVLDVDVSDGKRGDETLADLEATYGKLPATVTVITGSGGLHLYFKMPEGLSIANDAGKRLGPGLDIRGEGGQVVAPPTIHPNGRPYAWELSSHPDDTAVAEAPDWLIQLLVQLVSDGNPRHDRIDRGGSLLAGDLWASEHSWPELLTSVGARYLRTVREASSGQTYEQWSRPGVDHCSATLYYRGSDVLKVHSTNWPPFEPGATYTRFGFLTAVRFQGDFAAAAEVALEDWLARRGQEWREKADQVTAQAEGVTKGEKSNNHSLANHWIGERSWDEPVPLPASSPPPIFPVEVYPSWLASYVRSVALATQTPHDLGGCLALGCLSAVAGGRVLVEVDASWREGVNVFLAPALPPGTRKSAVFQAMSRPLFEAQEEGKAGMMTDRLQAQAARKAAKRALELAEGEWAKAGDHEKEAATERMRTAAILAESITVPVLPRLLADDATPEALGSLMAEQGGRIAVLSAEGDVFDLMAGRYSGTPNLGIYLKGHAGDPYVLDRKGRDPEFIARPALTIAVAVQPDVLMSIGDKPGFRGRGLLARFLYSVPDANVGHRLIEVPEVSVPTARNYDEHLRGLYASLAEWHDPMVLTLTPDARAALRTFQAELEGRLLTDLAEIVEWASKLAGAVVRIAGLLHLAHHEEAGYRMPVEGSTMLRAIEVGRYFAEHAKIAFGVMADSSVLLDAARKVVNAIRAEGWTSFYQRDLLRKVHARFPLLERLTPVLKVLDDRGWIRLQPPPLIRSAGRPPVVFDVNPLLTVLDPFRDTMGTQSVSTPGGR